MGIPPAVPGVDVPGVPVMAELKDYLIGFTGSADFRKVYAHCVKEAKEAFAVHEGVKVSGYIIAHKWTTDNWNYALKDDRPSISWTVIP